MDILSFGGAGFLMSYYWGVCKVLQSRFNFNNTTFHGISAGTFACMILCFDIDAEKVYEYMLKHDQINISSGYELYINILKKFIPPDEEWKKHGHKLNYYASKCCKKLLKCEKFTNIHNKKDGYKLILASSHIPIVCGYKPIKYKNNYYYDGSLTSNFSSINSFSISVNKNLKSDIMPSISIPYSWIVSPPSKDILQQFYFLGIHDTQTYFSKRSLILYNGSSSLQLQNSWTNMIEKSNKKMNNVFRIELVVFVITASVFTYYINKKFNIIKRLTSS